MKTKYILCVAAVAYLLTACATLETVSKTVTSTVKSVSNTVASALETDPIEDVGLNSNTAFKLFLNYIDEKHDFETWYKFSATHDPIYRINVDTGNKFGDDSTLTVQDVRENWPTTYHELGPFPKRFITNTEFTMSNGIKIRDGRVIATMTAGDKSIRNTFADMRHRKAGVPFDKWTIRKFVFMHPKDKFEMTLSFPEEQAKQIYARSKTNDPVKISLRQFFKIEQCRVEMNRDYFSKHPTSAVLCDITMDEYKVFGGMRFTVNDASIRYISSS